MSSKIRVVYDCMIFVQAAIRPERVHATMRLFRDGHVNLCVSSAIVEEVGDILTRPEMREKFPAFTPDRVTEFIDSICVNAEHVDSVPNGFELPRDRKDEPYINLAISRRPCHLVTWNYKHLTYLMRQDTAEGRDFCARFPDVLIVDPPAFVRFVQSESQHDR